MHMDAQISYQRIRPEGSLVSFKNSHLKLEKYNFFSKLSSTYIGRQENQKQVQ